MAQNRRSTKKFPVWNIFSTNRERAMMGVKILLQWLKKHVNFSSENNCL